MALITIEDIEGISPVFKGKFGNGLARTLMRITGIDKISEIYDRHENLVGPEFAKAYLKDLNISYETQGLGNINRYLMVLSSQSATTLTEDSTGLFSSTCSDISVRIIR
ncbi:MAG: hypothetical protein CW336_01195 [Bacteroidetes bacterium]|nr:hypothetical protein [Bacteroidota bacterium]